MPSPASLRVGDNHPGQCQPVRGINNQMGPTYPIADALQTALIGGTFVKERKDVVLAGSAHFLRADDATVEAAGPGVVDVDLISSCVFEHPLDFEFGIHALDDGSVQQHSLAVVRAQREKSLAQHFWNLVDARGCSLRALAHVNRPASAVGRVRRLVFVVEEHELLADLRIHQADPAGVAGLVVCDDAPRAYGRELRLGHRKTGLEPLVRERNDAEHSQNYGARGPHGTK